MDLFEGSVGRVASFVERPEKGADVALGKLTPHRLTSEPLSPRVAAFEESTRELMDDLLRRVLAEDARVRRLLPLAPGGFEWRGEFQQEVDGFSPVGDVRVRIVYRLTPVGEDYGTGWTV